MFHVQRQCALHEGFICVRLTYVTARIKRWVHQSHLSKNAFDHGWPPQAIPLRSCLWTFRRVFTSYGSTPPFLLPVLHSGSFEYSGYLSNSAKSVNCASSKCLNFHLVPGNRTEDTYEVLVQSITSNFVTDCRNLIGVLLGFDKYFWANYWDLRHEKFVFMAVVLARRRFLWWLSKDFLIGCWIEIWLARNMTTPPSGTRKFLLEASVHHLNLQLDLFILIKIKWEILWSADPPRLYSKYPTPFPNSRPPADLPHHQKQHMSGILEVTSWPRSLCLSTCLWMNPFRSIRLPEHSNIILGLGCPQQKYQT